jgi:tetratricopeptide (TPR) repeat protein
MNEIDLFTQALARTDPAERAAFLDQACAGNPDLRRRLDALLAGHAQADSPLDRPPAGPAGDAGSPDRPEAVPTGAYGPEAATGADGDAPAGQARPPAAGPGTVIAGRYTLLEVIGEGGMGSVYLASQAEPVKRQVALKLIKTGMDSQAVLARFDAERQALALMDHPNIARIYDGGLTPSGQPFFVMELVHGVPLTQYCDSHRLTIDARLGLFASVCQAVQHAHQKGVIHRDLKPGNVLVAEVDGRPTPKVIDFGVAKATEQKLTELSLADAGAVVGTPAYMSPEQADPAAMDVDTRTDVYALGVMLYELLAGSTPIDGKQFKRGAILEMLRMVREVEPPRPSTRLSTAEALPNIAASRSTEPGKLAKLLRGELDWVVMKALEKDRSRRYETANGLARDVQRYLADEVVEARPPSRGYRLRKFVKRNKGQVVAASLVLLALVGGVVGTTIGLLQATAAAAREKAAREREATQRTAAEKARDRTRDVLDAMVSDVTGDSLATQKAISAEQKKFLQSVLGYYREFAGENPDDERSRARHAEAAFRVGMIESRLGRKEEAAAAFRIARDGSASLAADFPAVPDYRKDLAASHNNLGLLLADLGQRAAAAEQYRKALAIDEKLAADFPAVPDYRRDLAKSHNNLGLLLADLGQRAAAEEQYRKALAIFEKLAADFPAVPDYRSALALSHNNLGVLLGGLGQRGAAEQFRKGLAILEKLATDFPAVPAYRQNLARSHNNLGNVLAGLGQGAAAAEQYRKGLAIDEKLAADFPAVPDYRNGLARRHINLGNVLQNLGQRAVAAEQYRKALAIFEKLAADFPAVPDYRQDLAGSQHSLGLLLAGLGQGAAAEEQYRKALAIDEKLAADFPAVPDYRRDLAKSHNNLGLLLADLGQRAAAEEQYRKALAIDEKLAADFPAVPDYRSDLAGSHNNLGNLLAGLGQRAAAEEQYRKGLAIFEKLAADFPAVPEYRRDLAGSHNCLGGLFKGLGQRAAAEEQYRKALALQEKLIADFPAVPDYRQHLAGSHNNLGNLLGGLGQRAAAEEQYRKGLAIFEKLAADFPAVPAYQVGLGGSYGNLGHLMRKGGDPAASLKWFGRAIDCLQAVHEKEPRDVTAKQILRNSHAGRALAHDRLQKFAEAVKDWDRAIALSPPAEQLPLRASLAKSHTNLRLLLAGLGQGAAAEKQYRKALAIWEKLAAEFPAVPDYRHDLAKSHINLGNLLGGLGQRAAAEEQYRKGLAIFEKLAADFPAVPAYQVGLGGSYGNLGHLMRKGGDPAASLKWFGRAIDCLQAVHEKEPRDVTAKQILRNSHAGRALAHDRLQKFAEAVKDWERAIALSPPAQQPLFRERRATSRLQAGMVAEAVAEVAELTKTPNGNAGQWYNFACVYAVASGKIADKKAEYAGRAMELLQKAVKAGWKDAAHIKKDTDLAPLRGRGDFQKLLADLEKRFPPPGKK